MYAVIQTGGKQHKVIEGQTLKVETLQANEGDKINFDEILMLGKDDNVTVGAPFVKGAKVSAEIVRHGRHKKIEILKFKRRKHHMKHMGHRQNFTEVKITGIKG